MTIPVPACPEPTPAERTVIDAARRARTACHCGGHCGEDCDPVTDDTVTRMRAYLTAHPDRIFATDNPDDPEIFAVILRPDASEIPTIIESRPTLPALLDAIGAPSAAAQS